MFLFFKQKTAYEMRISDWSSVVCSSDLVALAANFPGIPLPLEPPETSVAMVPAQRLAAMRDLVIERSHEIRAAEREAQRLAVVAPRVQIGSASCRARVGQ